MSVTQATLLGDTFGSKASGTIPIGGIIMWSGSVASVPTGWSICNGENGTPNLVDKFIVGAGSGYAVAATGGSANATLVSHSHTATSTVNEGLGHNHNLLTRDSTANQGTGQGANREFAGGGGAQGQVTTELNTTGITVSTAITPEGSVATNANLPPYYALAFIMRTP
jgi:microcystin-dependent protein